MTDVVLDASAILAWLQAEPGGDTVHQLLTSKSCTMSAVNASEVASKLADGGSDRETIHATIAALEVEVAAFDTADAVEAGLLRPLTRARGLSLADRACLALGMRLGVPVVTTDRAWAALSLPVTVTLAGPAGESKSPDENDARP